MVLTNPQESRDIDFKASKADIESEHMTKFTKESSIDLVENISVRKAMD